MNIKYKSESFTGSHLAVAGSGWHPGGGGGRAGAGAVGGDKGWAPVPGDPHHQHPRAVWRRVAAETPARRHHEPAEDLGLRHVPGPPSQDRESPPFGRQVAPAVWPPGGVDFWVSKKIIFFCF